MGHRIYITDPPVQIADGHLAHWPLGLQTGTQYPALLHAGAGSDDVRLDADRICSADGLRLHPEQLRAALTAAGHQPSVSVDEQLLRGDLPQWLEYAAAHGGVLCC